MCSSWLLVNIRVCVCGACERACGACERTRVHAVTYTMRTRPRKPACAQTSSADCEFRPAPAAASVPGNCCGPPPLRPLPRGAYFCPTSSLLPASCHGPLTHCPADGLSFCQTGVRGGATGPRPGPAPFPGHPHTAPAPQAVGARPWHDALPPKSIPCCLFSDIFFQFASLIRGAEGGCAPILLTLHSVCSSAVMSLRPFPDLGLPLRRSDMSALPPPCRLPNPQKTPWTAGALALAPLTAKGDGPTPTSRANRPDAPGTPLLPQSAQEVEPAGQKESPAAVCRPSRACERHCGQGVPGRHGSLPRSREGPTCGAPRKPPPPLHSKLLVVRGKEKPDVMKCSCLSSVSYFERKPFFREVGNTD